MFEFHLLNELKSRKIKFPFRSDIEPQEIFLDGLAKKREEDFGISEKKFEVPLSRKIIKGLFFFGVILVFSLFGRTFQLQVLENKKFTALAEENRFIIRSINASRGVIYDSNLRQLAYNRSSFNLILDKRNLPEDLYEQQKNLIEVAKILKKDFSELEGKINNAKESILTFAENLDNQTLILLETKIAEMQGFQISQNETRYYPDGDIFSHLIGYMGKVDSNDLKKNPEAYTGFDYIGKDGVEWSFEDVLRKNSGKMRIERDASGNIITKEVLTLPESGKSLVLWTDLELQKKLTEELKKTLERIGSKRASAVALDPNTGGVLAMVNIPSFNNNLFTAGADKEAMKNILNDPQTPLFNRAIAGLYPTGSTIKPLLSSAALQENLISPNKQIFTHGFIEIPHRYNPEIVYTYRDWKDHGWTDMRKAIAESNNIYFYTIGGGYGNQQGLGPTRIKKYLELFGWGNQTGIDLPGENQGLIPSPDWKKQNKNENWWDGDTYNLSIGQGDILITPIQVASAYAAIANGGTLYAPKVVKKIIKGSPESPQFEEVNRSEIIRENFIDPKNIQVVREGMRQAVTGVNTPDASSVTLNSLSVAAAAKTGTAQLPRDNYYDAWISVFAPYEKPQIVITIVIEDVKGLQVATLPVAKEVLRWYFSQNNN